MRDLSIMAMTATASVGGASSGAVGYVPCRSIWGRHQEELTDASWTLAWRRLALRVDTRKGHHGGSRAPPSSISSWYACSLHFGGVVVCGRSHERSGPSGRSHSRGSASSGHLLLVPRASCGCQRCVAPAHARSWRLSGTSPLTHSRSSTS